MNTNIDTSIVRLLTESFLVGASSQSSREVKERNVEVKWGGN